MKIVTWNVNGLRASVNSFFDYIADTDADIVAVQETRIVEPIQDYDGIGYTIAWNIAEQLGYAGTAIFHKKTPLNVKYGLGVKMFDREARVITLEYTDYFFVNVYVPNSQTDLDKWYFRLNFDTAFLKYIDHLRYNKNLIICGDFNVAHEHIDIYPENIRNPEEQYGFRSEERDGFNALLELGLIDVFRHINPTERAYTWWSQRHHRSENKGRRLDYILVSSTLISNVQRCKIRPDISGSDHAPVEMEIEL